jgi:hypothetical protein
MLLHSKPTHTHTLPCRQPIHSLSIASVQAAKHDHEVPRRADITVSVAPRAPFILSPSPHSFSLLRPIHSLSFAPFILSPSPHSFSLLRPIHSLSFAPFILSPSPHSFSLLCPIHSLSIAPFILSLSPHSFSLYRLIHFLPHLNPKPIHSIHSLSGSLSRTIYSHPILSPNPSIYSQPFRPSSTTLLLPLHLPPSLPPPLLSPFLLLLTFLSLPLRIRSLLPLHSLSLRQVDCRHMPCGGNDSWSRAHLPEYLVPAGRYRFAIRSVTGS